MILERGMLAFLTKVLLIVRRRRRSKAILRAENLVPRQQVVILSRKRPVCEVRVRNFDRLILVWLYRFFPSILNTITTLPRELPSPGFLRSPCRSGSRTLESIWNLGAK